MIGIVRMIGMVLIQGAKFAHMGAVLYVIIHKRRR